MPEIESGTFPCPYCGHTEAEPEQDGPVLYYACPECGSAWGYHLAEQDGPLCAAGLPIQVSAAQPAGVVTVESGTERRTVFLGGTIRRRG